MPTRAQALNDTPSLLASLTNAQDYQLQSRGPGIIHVSLKSGSAPATNAQLLASHLISEYEWFNFTKPSGENVYVWSDNNRAHVIYTEGQN